MLLPLNKLAEGVISLEFLVMSGVLLSNLLGVLLSLKAVTTHCLFLSSHTFFIRAESLPDIKTLKALADFYEITINDLLSDKKRVPKLEYKKRHLIITLMSVGLAFLLATTIYFITSLIFTYALTWLIYIYILPVASIILVVFSGLWAKRLWVTLSVSLLEWTSALSIFISLIMFVANLMEYAWLIFLVAFVLQLITILWHFYGIKISITKNATPSFKKKKN